uniref:Bromo domain-containing protein n=1 Tax=Musca domestica TaxID=7370 RepID=A0A1I8M287_MUSDO
MATVQERLQLNRTPLDKWSTREQLALASAVLSSGDQNWMSVSRTLKVLCGGNSKDNLQSRPGDWFSQKNCAVQYGHLLEDVETPKRKKRTSESSLSSSPPVEAPTEAIVRRLTEERMQEIKLELRRQQEEYASIVAEIKALKTGRLGDEEILQMWSDIEKEQEMLRIEEMKMENQLREREMRKQELQRNWRTSGGPVPSNSSSLSSLKSSTDTTAVDMDVEEIIGSTKPVTPSGSHSMQIPTGTSPLLTSLLKSPTASNSPSNLNSSSVSARASAPTITTLLTSGSIPNPNQPALIPAGDSAIQLLTRPISGPPLDSSLNSNTNQINMISPSQSAPTLSMLLEKNKSPLTTSTELKGLESTVTTSTNAETVIVSANDSNNESIPMDIEDDLPVTTTNAAQDADDIDDTDPNEEQQLMEVFKNIGNIDELDIDVSDVIDEEVDFLKGVDEEESALDEAVGDLEQKLEDNVVSDIVECIKQDDPSSINTTVDVKQESSIQQPESGTEAKTKTKTEIISSDDSNDNIPLAAVASLESSKDRINDSSNESSFLKEQEESAFPKNEPADRVDTEEGESTKLEIKQEMLDEHEQALIGNEKSNGDNEKVGIANLEDNKKQDIFVMPSTEDSKANSTIKTECEDDAQGNNEATIENDPNKQRNEVDDLNGESNHPPEQGESSEAHTLQPQSDLQSIEGNMDTSSSLSMLQPPPAISVADTDENSSSTDISVQTRKDEKLSNSKRHSSHYQRKSPHDAKTDDEMPNPSAQMAVPSSNSVGGSLTPRPTALRKLRDRDRSESPMIDDDATTQSDHSTTTTNQRSRRRYSSTPVIDSIPNSPASSDRDESRDLRTYKKSLLSIYNVLQNSKYASTIQRILSDETTPYKLEEVCLKQMDFASIKKNIESGVIRSAYELQRDILLMCQNALFVTKTNSAAGKAILALQQECQHIREFMPNFLEPHTKLDRDVRDTKSSGSTSSSTGGSTSKGRSGSRKSLRLS